MNRPLPATASLASCDAPAGLAVGVQTGAGSGPGTCFQPAAARERTAQRAPVREPRTPAPAAPARNGRAPGLAPCFAFVGASGALLLGLEQLLARGLTMPFAPAPGDPPALLAIGFAALVGVVALAWLPLRRMLRSVAFSIALLTALLVGTMLGTLVLQGGAPEEYPARYGQTLAALLFALRLEDVFASLWFRGWVALVATSVLLVLVSRQVWKPALWGTALCHAGTLVVLIGGALGNVAGFRGWIDLREGESASFAQRLAGVGEAGLPHSLGFTVRLDRFELEPHPEEYRLRLYERVKDRWRMSRSLTAKDVGTSFAVEGITVRLVAVHPELRLLRDVHEAPPEIGLPALRVEVPAGEGWAERGLFAGVAGRDALTLADGTRVRILASPPTGGELASLAQPRPEAHVVQWRRADGQAGEVRVRPGTVHELGAADLRLRVLRQEPDFSYSIERREIYSRSENPDNPALEIVLEGPAASPAAPRWLFARLGEDSSHGDSSYGHVPPGSPRLVYRYEPAFVPVEREVLFLASAREAWDLSSGALTGLLDVDDEGTLLLEDGTRISYLPSALESETATSASDEWRDPVAELKLEGPGGTERVLLAALHPEPLHFPGGEVVAIFERKTTGAKAYRSDLVVLEEGREVAAKTIVVNDPLAWRGYHIYQSSFDREDPTYSGLLVVRDPGLHLVFIGFVLLALGVFYHAWLRSRNLRRRIVR